VNARGLGWVGLGGVVVGRRVALGRVGLARGPRGFWSRSIGLVIDAIVYSKIFWTLRRDLRGWFRDFARFPCPPLLLIDHRPPFPLRRALANSPFCVIPLLVALCDNFGLANSRSCVIPILVALMCDCFGLGFLTLYFC